MSQVHPETIPVMKCKNCGDPLRFSFISTAAPDPLGVRLRNIMNGLDKIKYCPECLKKYNYAASQGRSQEFLDGGV